MSLPASEASDSGLGQASGQDIRPDAGPDTGPDAGTKPGTKPDTGPDTGPDAGTKPAHSDGTSVPPAAVGNTHEKRPRGLPGGRVVVVATLIVVATAVIEVVMLERIGEWTGAALVVVSVASPLVTRAGDRSLPAMMPPLAFLAAVLVAGQHLLPGEPGSWRNREVVMLAQTLGSNAAWVVAATILSTSIAAIGHLVGSHRRRRTSLG